MNKIQKFKQRRAKRILDRADSRKCRLDYDKKAEEYQWVTVNGTHVPIDDAGNVVGGAGGALNGKNFSNAKKYKAGDFSHIKKKLPNFKENEPKPFELTELGKSLLERGGYQHPRYLKGEERSKIGSSGDKTYYLPKEVAKKNGIGFMDFEQEHASEYRKYLKKNKMSSSKAMWDKFEQEQTEKNGGRNYSERYMDKAQKSGDKNSIREAVSSVAVSARRKPETGFRVGESVYVKNSDGSYRTRKGGKGEWTTVSEKDAKSLIANEIAGGAKFSSERYDWRKSKLPDVKKAKDFIKRALKGNSGTTNCADSADPRAERSSFRANVKDGKLTPEREELHQQIVANAFMVKDKDGNITGEVKKAKGKPVYTFLGGGPAAGKSTITDMLKKQGKFPQDDEAVTLNPDDYKEMLPEAKKWAENPPDTEGYSGWANNTHEESSAISKRINAVACGNGYNVVNDACNNSGAAKVIKKINEARAAGMEVAGVYVTCPTEEALKRNALRSSGESSKGRLPLTEVVRDTHIDISRIFEEIAPYFDHIELYDTMRKDKDNNPLLIASCKRGEKVTVHDDTAYKEFLAKGNQETTKEEKARIKG